jgi:hypothetical protein
MQSRRRPFRKGRGHLADKNPAFRIVCDAERMCVEYNHDGRAIGDGSVSWSRSWAIGVDPAPQCRDDALRSTGGLEISHDCSTVLLFSEQDPVSPNSGHKSDDIELFTVSTEFSSSS